MPLDLNQIASLANVSRSTVSRVVNQHPDVKPEVRERVQKIIEETGYQPNFAARSLRSKPTDVIGLVISNSVSGLFGYPYFQALVDGIMQACDLHQKTLAIFLAGDAEKFFPRLTRRGYLDGILIQANDANDSLLQKILSTDIPCVCLGRSDMPAANTVDIDSKAGAMLATRQLLALQRQRIAMIGGRPDHASAIDRHHGYEQALQEAGRTALPDLLTFGDYTENSGYRAMQQLLVSRPDAVFAANDAMAWGAMRAIHEAGLSIPKDIAIVGFDDLPAATPLNPPLTTIRQPIEQVSARAVERLMELIQNPVQRAQQVVVPVELIVRQSA